MDMQDSKDRLWRYSRQVILDGFGCSGQETLRKSGVLVVGAGGLGSTSLLYLAAAGVGTLGIADFDAVGISDLNRQILHSTVDLGRKKTDSAEDSIKNLNPEIEVVKYPFRLNSDNIEEILGSYDVIVDATDNPTARYLISDCCHLLGKPLIEGAAAGFEGLLMTIIPGKSPCYRCLYPIPPADGVIPMCSDIGILGAVTGTIGSLQAFETIKVLLGVGTTLSGRILSFDGLKMKFTEINLQRNPTCSLCGENPTIKDLTEYDVTCRTKK